MRYTFHTILVACLLSCTLVSAQQTEATAQSTFIGLGMPAELAASVASLLDGKADSSGHTIISSATGKSIKLNPTGDANRLLTFSAASDAAYSIAYGDGSTAAQHLDIKGSSVDGSDDGYIIMGPGGANSLERGAAIVMYGNEASSNAGDLKLDCGNVSGAVVEVITPAGLASDASDYKVRWYWTRGSGNFTQDDTNGGNIMMSKSGTGLVVGGGNDAWSFITTECSLLSTAGGTTQTWTSALPAYATLLALTGRIVTAYTSGGTITSLHVGNGSTADQYANALALTANTTWTSPEAGAAGGTMPQANAASAQNIVVTANGGGNIATGSMRICETYIRSQVPQS